MATGRIGTTNKDGQMVTDPRNNVGSRPVIQSNPSYSGPGSSKVYNLGGTRVQAPTEQAAKDFLAKSPNATPKDVPYRTNAEFQNPQDKNSEYLKSLNKPGNPNYVPVPGDPGFKEGGQTPTAITAPQGGMPTASASPSQQEYENAKASGLPGPKTAGEFQVQKGQFSSQRQPDTAVLDTMMSGDKTIDGIFKQWADSLSPEKQQKSLVDEYKSILKTSGIQDINAELINTQKIIDGTEDDIRAEVTAASGFATDSQVLAMASARNKSLIKNYNALMATRDSLNDQVNTMMTLTQQDRQMASQRIEQQLNLGFKILDYKDKMQNNAKEGYNNIVNQLGYKGLYESLKNNPYEMSLAEKILGLGQGGLANLASQRDLDREYKIAQINATNRSNRETSAPTGQLNDKQIKLIDTSPQGKKLKALGDLQAIQKQYKTLVDTYGFKATGAAKTLIDNAYADFKIAYKTAAELGALTGPDVGIIEEAIKPSAGGLRKFINYKIAGGQKGVSGGVQQSMNKAKKEALTNYKQLVARDNSYKGSDYTTSLIDPFSLDLSTFKDYNNVPKGEIVRTPDGMYLESLGNGNFESL